MALPWGSIISAGSALLGGILGNRSNKSANDKNAAMQMDAAKNQVQWRVADAQKAGVSPLVALGMSPISVSPSFVGDTALPSALSSMGQDIGRAVEAGSPRAVRADAYAEKAKELSLVKMGLENDLLASQIAKLNSAGGVPAIDGSGDVIPGQQGNSLRSIVSGRRIPTGPGSPAEKLENEYGEFVGDIYGAVRFLADGLRRLRVPEGRRGTDVTGGMPY